MRDPAACEDLEQKDHAAYLVTADAPKLSIRDSVLLFLGLSAFLIVTHAPLLRLPYFWDEAGYYVPAARDLLSGSLIPYSTPSNAHPPLVMAGLALAWKFFGQSPLITRCAMLLLAAFSLTGLYRLARSVSNRTVAVVTTLLTALYPVFFAQSSLAQVDLPGAGLTFWGLEAYVRRRWWAMAAWFSLAALAKETSILAPLALLAWELGRKARHLELQHPNAKLHSFLPNAGPFSLKQSPVRNSKTKDSHWRLVGLLAPVIPLALWYGYHYAHTGFVFGNPAFLRYNLENNFHPLRILLALLLRLWQTAGYLNLYVLTLACLLAIGYPALQTDGAQRQRIDLRIQFSFLAIAMVYWLALSVLGGAVLARYLLPIVPLVILICVSTIWRRLKLWKVALGVVALAFVAAIFVNPPYGFSPEDNLAYVDYIRMHQHAEAFVETKYPHAHVLTAWPASDELSRPYLGYVGHPMQVVRIEDFTAEQLLAAADAPARFDVALVFSTKYQPPHSFLDRWRRWQEWKTRYFGYHLDLTPLAAASVLGGKLVYMEYRHGQWVGVIETERAEEAKLQVPSATSKLR
jgi:Dolichyl-phosphate-mannose-protein mannosyltransferase